MVEPSQTVTQEDLTTSKVEPQGVTNQGMTKWDALLRFAQSLKKWVLYLGIIIAVGILLWLGAWWFIAAIVVGAPYAYILAKYWLPQRFTFVHELDEEAHFTTYQIGPEKFERMKKSGAVSPVVSKSGRNVWFALKVDLDLEEMKSAWITEGYVDARTGEKRKISPFEYYTDFRTARWMYEDYLALTEKYLRTCGYPLALGKIQAVSVVNAQLEDYQRRLTTLDITRFKAPDAAHEYLQTPLEKDGALVEENLAKSEDALATEQRIDVRRKGVA